MILTGGLVCVGWHGVRAAMRTLKAIQRQAYLMRQQVGRMDQQRIDSNKSSADNLAALNRQIAALEGQVGIAHDTAEATKNIVNATIRSERAWVIVRPIQSSLRPVVSGMIRPYNQMFHDIVNKGRTVAKLIALNAAWKVIADDEALPVKPDYPPLESDHVQFLHGAVMVPEEVINGASIWINELERLPQALSGNMSLYVYGYIEYFDFAETRREIRFCYRYIPLGEDASGNRIYWSLDGPTAYNAHS